eukprot:17294-Eustigmatos_ZCMA.PRE.1
MSWPVAREYRRDSDQSAFEVSDVCIDAGWQGNTALHYSAGWGTMEVTALLLEVRQGIMITNPAPQIISNPEPISQPWLPTRS